MDMLFKKQTDFILSRGYGIKACLFDEDTKQYISNLIPYSRFQESDFFFFDYLSNRKRTPILDVSCVVIIRPANLKNLIEEISEPLYGSYVVLFTSPVDPFVLEILANADSKCVVSEVHEINLDLRMQSPYLYTTGSSKYKQAVDGLSSVLFSLEISPSCKMLHGGRTKPQPQPGADEAARTEEARAPGREFEAMARELESRASSHGFKKEGILVFLSRRFDMVTPLVHDWHYQSMIMEYAKYDNGTVKIAGKEHSLNDSFFESNKFNNIHQVGDSIQGLVRELEKNKIRISNHEFEDIEEKAAHSLMVNTHMAIYDALMEACVGNKDISELEMEFLKNGTIGGEAATRDALRRHAAGLEESQQLKLLILYMLRRDDSCDELAREFPKHSESLRKFVQQHGPRPCPYRPTYETGCDIKLAYRPPLAKMVKHLLQGRVRPGALVDLSGAPAPSTGPLIVYVEDGLTMAEYREALAQASALDRTVFLVTDRIITASDVIHSITDFHK